METTQDLTLTPTPAVTQLVAAGEAFFTALTGQEMSANQQKISDGITSILDGLIPTVATKVSFDLNGVLAGATEALDGVAKTVTSAKSKAALSETLSAP